MLNLIESAQSPQTRLITSRLAKSEALSGQFKTIQADVYMFHQDITLDGLLPSFGQLCQFGFNFFCQFPVRRSRERGLKLFQRSLILAQR